MVFERSDMERSVSKRRRSGQSPRKSDFSVSGCHEPPNKKQRVESGTLTKGGSELYLPTPHPAFDESYADPALVHEILAGFDQFVEHFAFNIDNLDDYLENGCLDFNEKERLDNILGSAEGSVSDSVCLSTNIDGSDNQARFDGEASDAGVARASTRREASAAQTLHQQNRMQSQHQELWSSQYLVQQRMLSRQQQKQYIFPPQELQLQRQNLQSHKKQQSRQYIQQPQQQQQHYHHQHMQPQPQQQQHQHYMKPQQQQQQQHHHHHQQHYLQPQQHKLHQHYLQKQCLQPQHLQHPKPQVQNFIKKSLWQPWATTTE